MKMIIGDGRVDAAGGKTIPVTNPYDGSLVDTVPDAGKEDIDRAVAYAVRAQKEWKKVPVHERVAHAQAFLDLVREQKEDLARTMTLESGKTITESRNEINNLFTAWPAFCEMAKHLYGEVFPVAGERGQEKNLTMAVREPIGVVACVVPFNFPANLFTQKVAPALLSGNAAIVKPASDNPLTVLKIVELLRQAGFPAGVIQAVTGRGSTAGSMLCAHPGVHAVTLTGSTKVGVSVAAQAAETLKKVALELGGNDAFLVLQDADLDLAVREAVNTRFYYAGQICCAPKRFIIHESLYGKFLEESVRLASERKAGDPLDDGTQVATLISEKAAIEVEEQIQRTVRQGARILVGGTRDGARIMPTVLADVPRDADIMHDTEVFGPVMAVTSFTDEDEALALANDTSYGLGGSVFTNDIRKAIRFSREMECGSVVVNGSSYLRSFEMPFGGWKQSGIGAEGVSATFEELTRVKCVTLKGMLDG